MTDDDLVVSTGAHSATVGPGPDRDALPWRETHRLMERDVDAPAPTVDSKVGSGWRVHRPGERSTIVEGAVVVRTSMGKPKVDGRNGTHELDPFSRPMHTVTSKTAEAVVTYPAIERHRGAGMVERDGERPARPTDHPSLAVTGNASGTTPGGFRFTDGSQTRKITLEEAARLQSYPDRLIHQENTLNITALDDFAGTGWGVACAWLGIQEYGVELMDEAVETRRLNGMVTIGRDVWTHIQDREDEAQSGGTLDYDLYIASPPCQTFSMAGKGSGRKALDEVVGLIDSKAYQDVDLLHEFGERHDPRTALVLVPLVRAYRDLPRHVVLEQVPTVLPVWERMAEEMRRWGYSVWTGKLYAEQYGVPQTRIRAVLIAKRDPDLDGEAKPPTPTHSRYYSRDPKRLDPDVEPWVSMATALEWGMTDRPYMSVASGTEKGGGTDPAALGGSGARKTVMDEKESGRWVQRSNFAAPGEPGQTAAERGRTERKLDQPSVAMTGKPGHWAEPGSPTADGAVRIDIDEAAALQSYPKPFIFAGGKGKQFLQVGNAVPPLLAKAILEAVLAQ